MSSIALPVANDKTGLKATTVHTVATFDNRPHVRPCILYPFLLWSDSIHREQSQYLPQLQRPLSTLWHESRDHPRRGPTVARIRHSGQGHNRSGYFNRSCSPRHNSVDGVLDSIELSVRGHAPLDGAGEASGAEGLAHESVDFVL